MSHPVLGSRNDCARCHKSHATLVTLDPQQEGYLCVACQHRFHEVTNARSLDLPVRRGAAPQGRMTQSFTGASPRQLEPEKLRLKG